MAAGETIRGEELQEEEAAMMSSLNYELMQGDTSDLLLVPLIPITPDQEVRFNLCRHIRGNNLQSY